MHRSPLKACRLSLLHHQVLLPLDIVKSSDTGWPNKFETPEGYLQWWNLEEADTGVKYRTVHFSGMSPTCINLYNMSTHTWPSSCQARHPFFLFECRTKLLMESSTSYLHPQILEGQHQLIWKEKTTWEQVLWFIHWMRASPPREQWHHLVTDMLVVADPIKWAQLLPFLVNEICFAAPGYQSSYQIRWTSVNTRLVANIANLPVMRKLWCSMSQQAITKSCKSFKNFHGNILSCLWANVLCVFYRHKSHLSKREGLLQSFHL